MFNWFKKKIEEQREMEVECVLPDYHYWMIVTKRCNHSIGRVEYLRTIVRTQSEVFPYADYFKSRDTAEAVISVFPVDEGSYNYGYSKKAPVNKLDL